MIIAVDGPAASGKGSLARRLAQHYRLNYLDTGLLYRAVAAQMLAAQADLSQVDCAVKFANKLIVEDLDEAGLRAPGIGEAASKIAVMPELRAALLALQRRWANHPPGAVLDGRDIGTMVCPDADIKLYVTASAETRAARRAAEWRAHGKQIDAAAVLADIEMRDARDMRRAVAPLLPAADAHLLETDKLDIDAVFRAAVAIIDGA